MHFGENSGLRNLNDQTLVISFLGILQGSGGVAGTSLVPIAQQPPASPGHPGLGKTTCSGHIQEGFLRKWALILLPWQDR